jgi:hypothetical protein
MLDKAFAHALGEVGLHILWESVKGDLEPIQRAHDSIHEFIYIAPLMFPREGGPSWHTRSAFLLYHWEVGDTAHRSLLEALCGYYNTAFTLLRTALELVLKGAFYEGLAHRQFRAKSHALGKDENGRRLKQFLDNVITNQPSVAEAFEKTSAAIYDRVESIIDEPRYRPSIKTILAQLSEWGFLERLRIGSIRDVYSRLSKDVHALPDYTDVGRVLLGPSELLFESKKVDRKVLCEYLQVQCLVMDVGIEAELNILRDNMKFANVRSNLAGQIRFLEELGMTNAVQVMTELLGEHDSPVKNQTFDSRNSG